MTYPSLEAFYAGDERRRTSRERDVGLFWRGRGGSTYRAAWVQATGELYVLEHGRPHCRGGFVRVVGRYGARELEDSFAGWREQCGRARSLDWLLDRAQPGSTDDPWMPRSIPPTPESETIGRASDVVGHLRSRPIGSGERPR